MENIVSTVEERFWDKVDKSGECWVWLGAKNNKGYGMFRYSGKLSTTHRISYQLFYGEIPHNLNVCHTCDNPACVNPEHLWAGTQSENLRDASQKKRTASGESHGMARLTKSEVVEIRKLRMSGMSQSEIAKKFSVTPSTISYITNNKVWSI